MRIDPDIYDAPQYDVEVPDTGLSQTQYQAPQPVSQGTVLAGQQSQAVALAAQAEFERPKAGVFAAAGAAITEWSPVQAYRWATAPSFEPDEDGVDVGALVASIDTPLAPEEREFLFKDLTSHAEYNYRWETIERQRFAQRAMGDSPIASFVATMVDPGYLMMDGLMMGTGTLSRLAGAGRATQRLTVGASTAVGTGLMGLAEQQVRPVSDTEIIVGALMNGAATSMLYRAGRVEPADPDFPGEVLHNLTKTMTITNPDRGVAARLDFAAGRGNMRAGTDLLEHLRSRTAGTDYSEILDVIAASPDLGRIRVTTDPAIGSLAPKARGFWDEKQGVLYLREDTGIDTAVHELLHATVERRMTSNPAMRRELTSMRDEVVRRLQNAGPDHNATEFWGEVFKKPHEFVAYAMSSPKFREWAKQQELGASGRSGFISDADVTRPAVPDAPAPATVWERVVDFIAKVLGMQGPTARKLQQHMDAVEFAADPANAKFKSLDDRLKEMAREVNAKPDLYTRGTVKGIQANTSETTVRARIAKVADKENIGRSIAWNLHKTLSSFGTAGKAVADLLVDNPLDMTGDSVVSQARAVRAGLSDLQFQYEDLLSKELAARKAGILNRIKNPRKSLETQRGIEKELQLEMLRRERNGRLGTQQPSNASPAVQKMADTLDKLYATALKEMQAAGVKGADAVSETSGYFSRKWDISNIDEAKTKLVQLGRTPEEAAKVLEQIVQQGLRRANGWDADTSRIIARAILDRAHRKGYFEDAAFRSHAGNAAAKEMRDILSASGASEKQIQKAMDVMTGVVDEAGKLSELKHRLDIDMKAGIALPDGSVLTVADLINSDLTRGTEAYLDHVAGRIALARKGLPNITDVDKLRDQLMESIPEVGERGKAAKLFDSTVDSIMGRPTGEDLPDAMRNVQAVTRMVGLASSGLWQVTEYATAMSRFGALKVLGAAMKEASFSALRRADRETSSQLADVLARNSSADIRIRPFINRLEDNFDVPTGAIVQSALLQAQQLVPYLNAQKFVQTHQARMVSNLVVDTFRRAGQGDQKAIKALESYGLEPHIMTRIQSELAEAGMDTAKWSDSTWADVRGPLQKMMDDSVLRNRTGEIPAFAQFSQVGKFIFTFRSFVLGAHNKVLAGTISRDGLAGISLLMLYQFPLVLLATQANSVVQGKEIKDTEELIAKSFGQMGSLGLFSEIFGVVMGEKQQFGAPGFIAIDRVYKLAGAALSGDPGATANAAIQAMPIMSIVPGARAIGETFKESTKE